jgi:hypothetical protein
MTKLRIAKILILQLILAVLMVGFYLGGTSRTMHGFKAKLFYRMLSIRGTVLSIRGTNFRACSASGKM